MESQTELPIVNRVKNIINQNSIAIKEEISWGTVSGVMGYIGYRAAKKCGYGLLTTLDPLSIGVSITAGIIGVGLVDYTYHNAHRVSVKINKSDYVTGIGEEKDNEKKLIPLIQKSKNSQTSWAAMFQNLKYLNATDKPVDMFKGKEISGDIDKTLFAGLGGVLLVGASIVSNPIGFKTANVLLPDVHPWALGMFSFGLNMFAIKTLYSLGARIFFPPHTKKIKR